MDFTFLFNDFTHLLCCGTFKEWFNRDRNRFLVKWWKDPRKDSQDVSTLFRQTDWLPLQQFFLFCRFINVVINSWTESCCMYIQTLSLTQIILQTLVTWPSKPSEQVVYYVQRQNIAGGKHKIFNNDTDVQQLHCGLKLLLHEPKFNNVTSSKNYYYYETNRLRLVNISQTTIL